jgi:hypothetical protein
MFNTLFVPSSDFCATQCKLTFKSLAVSLRTTRFNIKKSYMVLALRRVFCTDLRTGNGLCYIRHYNRGGNCLQRGTD